MTETSGSNNPRAQRGSHASQPVGKTNNPRLSQPVGASNNPRHSQPVGASRSQPVGPQSSQPLNSVNVPANVVPVLPEGNPYSRAAAGGDYAQDRRRKKRKRIALGALAAVLVLALGGVGMAFAYINQIESNFSEDITPEVQEALEKPADYDGGTFYMLLMGTDKSKEREKGEYAGDTFRSD